MQKLMLDGGVPNAEVVPDNRSQMLRSPDDWWLIALGSGLRGTIDAMDGETAARIRDNNIAWIRDNGVTSVETNVIYAAATKAAL